MNSWEDPWLKSMHAAQVRRGEEERELARRQQSASTVEIDGVSWQVQLTEKDHWMGEEWRLKLPPLEMSIWHKDGYWSFNSNRYRSQAEAFAAAAKVVEHKAKSRIAAAEREVRDLTRWLEARA